MRLCAAAALGMFACGGGPAMPSDASSSSDAVTTDAASDAPPDAPWTVGTIKVTARNGGINPFVAGAHPAANTPIVFTDATQQTQVVMTDADGVASATVTGPTTITHVQQWSSIDDEAMAVIGVMPGDEIVLERMNRDFTATAPIQVSFTPAASTGYWACTACKCEYGTTSPIAVPMTEDCQTDPAPVVLLAASGATLVTYATGSTAYDRTSGGALSLAPAQALSSYTGAFTALSATVSTMRFSFRAGFDDYKNVVGPASSETLEVHSWDGLPRRLLAHLSRSDGAMQIVSEDVTGTTPPTFALDGSLLLPWLGVPYLDVDTATIHVPSLPGGQSADLVAVTFLYQATSGRSVVFTILAAESGTYAIPTIPASVLDVTPKPGTTGGTASFAFASEAIDGFAEARRDPFRLWREALYGGSTVRTFASQSPFANAPYSP